MVGRVRGSLIPVLLVALAVGTCSVLVFAAQQPTFRAGTQIVSLFATVTDAQKRLVPDLQQADFEVFDNEKPQPLVFFQNETQPITIVIMLDTSGSMTLSLDLLRAAAEQFALRLLPADKAKVGAFNDKIQIKGLQFTNDRDQLITDIKDLDFGNGTRLWDALVASEDELKGIEGRRVILVFTDGDDTESHNASLGKVIERARAEEVMIYAIGLESQYFNGQRTVRSKPDSGLRKIADETGGGYFELTKTAELAPTFTRVAQELHSQYVLGFTPTVLDGKVHKLAVRVKQPGMNARARKSYLAATEKSVQ
ncbi:MAG TPA: VWA domain-containing protein [Vicinamibacterales bacterium]|nr:VWA domain-containing protein [Vicinamibacterales bacterium]